MSNFVVLLRGVNVGGVNLKMAAVRTALAAPPLRQVRTLLASGNVICAADVPAATVKTHTETVLREAFGYDAWVVVVDEAQLLAILAACPFPADDPAQHSYLTLSSDPAMLDELMALGAGFLDAAPTRLSPECLAWRAPAGGTLESPFSKLTAKARYKSSTTTRNLRTLLKCRDAVAARPEG